MQQPGALVTGASGFIGRALVKRLMRSGYHVVALTRSGVTTFPAGVKIAVGDLATGAGLSNGLLGAVHCVFNCAGELAHTGLMREVHVGGTRRLLQIVSNEMARSGRSIHWVQLSSVGVYGPPPASPSTERVVTEESALRPVGEYEQTKTQSDELLIEIGQRRGISFSIIRPSNVIGATMPNRSLYALGKMVEKGLFFYVGRRPAIATYVHEDDVVETLLGCATDPRARGEVFNLSNDCLLSEMIDGMACALGVRPPWLRLPERVVRMSAAVVGSLVRTPLTQSRIDALVMRTRYPYRKLEQAMGISPRVSVPIAIREVLATL